MYRNRKLNCLIMKISEMLYHRYEYLASRYANKIFSYEQLSFEREDLVQEFRIKIFTTIKAYGRRWLQYRRGLSTKPVPLKYYLAAACSNKMRDFTKYITRENYKISLDEISYDYGVCDDTVICVESNTFVLRGIDLLEGLVGKKRIVFSLYLRGYPQKILNKVYCNKANIKLKGEIQASVYETISASGVVEMQKKYLIRKYGNELLQNTQIFSTYKLDEN